MTRLLVCVLVISAVSCSIERVQQHCPDIPDAAYVKYTTSPSFGRFEVTCEPGQELTQDAQWFYCRCPRQEATR